MSGTRADRKPPGETRRRRASGAGRDTRVECGRDGELLAEAYLKELGYRPIDRHFVLRGGEIDLVMADGPTIVFIEVRRRRSARGGDPLESIGHRKRSHLVRAARVYLTLRGLHGRPCRFDVVAVREGARSGSAELQHLPDAFRADGPFS